MMKCLLLGQLSHRWTLEARVKGLKCAQLEDGLQMQGDNKALDQLTSKEAVVLETERFNELLIIWHWQACKDKPRSDETESGRGQQDTYTRGCNVEKLTSPIDELEEAILAAR
ncbi:uncharacterized protein [Nicotiana tomentosiformis]|uniref:uncharacterized protein isoform X2 n=1 Tax=Nicotiana tomentosiformis TaxID=4098 RepID=UPI00388C9A6D